MCSMCLESVRWVGKLWDEFERCEVSLEGVSYERDTCENGLERCWRWRLRKVLGMNWKGVGNGMESCERCIRKMWWMSCTRVGEFWTCYGYNGQVRGLDLASGKNGIVRCDGLVWKVCGIIWEGLRVGTANDKGIIGQRWVIRYKNVNNELGLFASDTTMPWVYW